MSLKSGVTLVHFGLESEKIDNAKLEAYLGLERSKERGLEIL